MGAGQPMIIAHRGARGMAPENTIAAFRLGLDQGCEGIELDVHLTADGEIVVCHDETLDRTTDGKGRINDMTLEQIKRYDAGSWYSDSFRGERVPTLDEVFDLVPESIMVNVEIKQYDGQMEHKLVDFMRRRNLFERVVVSSFDHKSVRRIKLLEPKTKIGLLYQERLFDPSAYARTFDVEVYSLHPHHKTIEADDVAKAVELGYRVYPWTANEEQDLNKMIACGASGIITDYPGRLKSLLS
ncbi:glycerophosphodiester phosphodiesterase [Gordoniibacillus kamchatkensis]|uniref:Glycerophosphodiester phosphodiesterase n=1 Tax=Gordoniibacillus kamchatkensis TaxID=1590651 RepID=A0ABR5ACI8_9BACL|nr:glycerophosphodiester phosphodiesterase [Paenibacillus sp. VKM B-2647]KIL38543.1 glycerophosphodiester phosphodiesterase [Paenibacillus sp. VKM B-2647]